MGKEATKSQTTRPPFLDTLEILIYSLSLSLSLGWFLLDNFNDRAVVQRQGGPPNTSIRSRKPSLSMNVSPRTYITPSLPSSIAMIYNGSLSLYLCVCVLGIY
ncbi:hypothetical protein Ancab_039637 [Ancistrocladus abbreviatus]